MRLATAGLAGALAIGCKKDDFSFPVWSDGLLLQGDCQEDYEVVDGVAADPVAELPDPELPGDPVGTDPLWHMDDLPDPIGVVVRDAAEYSSLWNETMNFGSWPAVDFETKQALFVWTRNTDACGISVDQWSVNTKADLGIVLDVQFYDDAMNCPTSCGTDAKAMVMVAIDREHEASVCRRIRPGCLPSETTAP